MILKLRTGKMMPESSTGRKLRLGIVGIGVGASEILPAME
jgi:F420-0:gamma-glutamyl ligase